MQVMKRQVERKHEMTKSVKPLVLRLMSTLRQVRMGGRSRAEGLEPRGDGSTPATVWRLFWERPALGTLAGRAVTDGHGIVIVTPAGRGVDATVAGSAGAARPRDGPNGGTEGLMRGVWCRLQPRRRRGRRRRRLARTASARARTGAEVGLALAPAVLAHRQTIMLTPTKKW